MAYGSPYSGLRKYLWSDLDQASLNIEGVWIMIEDFNAVLHADELSNPRNRSSFRSIAFHDWMFHQGLIDMGYVGTKFTRTRGNSDLNFKGARLDRALCNLE